MPRSSNQKMRPIYLARILLERTDENNTLTAQGIIDALSAYDIPATRKVVYEDVEALIISSFAYQTPAKLAVPVIPIRCRSRY